MADIRTSRIDHLKNSHVSNDGETITIVYETPNGNTRRLEMTPEMAASLTTGVQDAGRQSAARRKARGVDAHEPAIWTAERVFASHPVRGKIYLHVHTGGLRVIYDLPAASVATLVQDLSASLRTHAESNPGTDIDPSSGDVIPNTLTSNLLTPPISTTRMTDYPDGLAIEVGMLSDRDVQQRLRFPMFAETARTIIKALQEELARMGQTNANGAKPS